ncbi:V-set and immunoglobulin domain-containing protein 8 isoform X2 [Pseudophryne corroboree]|uniref:V-set and immunoglobulin domain-containing protein 8 isoform X2 n=1 Tax=Pseudophryne corroboree TaxID=495146 RepID=UPI0030814132
MGDPWVVLLIVVGLMPAVLSALTINEPSTETINRAKGESVTLGCTYNLDPSDTGPLDIEWSLMNPDSTALDSVILTYMDNTIVSRGPLGLMSRLSFTTTDPSKGDASIIIGSLEAKDSGTYQCKVKKNPGLASRKVTLIVQVIPAHPQCWVAGEQTRGQDVTLKCKSDDGTPPLSFKWEKIAGPPNPASPVMNMATLTGDLLIKNLSDAYAGAYQCTVGNNVGSGTCVADLSVSSANRTGIIIGAVFGALLLLLLLLLLIWCLICCCNKKRYEKEMANDIREDVVAPPPSHSNSRASSIRTAVGYTPHNISYSLRRAYNAAPRQETPTSSLSSNAPIKLKVESPAPSPEQVFDYPAVTTYHPYNIQRVGGVPVMVPAQTREGFIV